MKDLLRTCGVKEQFTVDEVERAFEGLVHGLLAAECSAEPLGGTVKSAGVRDFLGSEDEQTGVLLINEMLKPIDAFAIDAAA